MAWIPIESNPEVMNKFIANLGVPDKWQFVDVLSLDPEMLGMIPRPSLALILLFPTSPKYEELKDIQDAEIKEKGQEISPKVYYLKQKISNSCGTVALVHCIANNQDSINLKDGFMKQFLEETKDMNPDERGEAFAKNLGFQQDHQEMAAEGQSQLPSDGSPVIHHFVAFVHVDGGLYELDGRKSFPINHGPTSPATFVEDAAKVMTEIMKKDPDEVGFTVCALSAKLE